MRRKTGITGKTLGAYTLAGSDGPGVLLRHGGLVRRRPELATNRSEHGDLTASSERRGEAGATMVEFAITAALIFIFLLCSLELLRFGWSALSAQYAVNVATRKVAVFNCIAPGHLTQIQNAVHDTGLLFGVDIPASSVRVCRAENVNVNDGRCNPGTDNVGEPRELIQVEAVFPFRFVLGNYEFPIRVSSLGKNEPLSTP